MTRINSLDPGNFDDLADILLITPKDCDAIIPASPIISEKETDNTSKLCQDVKMQ